MALWHDENAEFLAQMGEKVKEETEFFLMGESAESLGAELRRIQEEMSELGAYGLSEEYETLQAADVVSQEEMANQLLTWNGEQAQWATISAVEPSYDFHFSHQGEEIVTIHHDGTLEYGVNYTPDAAAEVFWNNIAMQSPQALKQRIAELEAQVGKLQTEKEVLEYHLKGSDNSLDDMVVIREPVDVPPKAVHIDTLKDLDDYVVNCVTRTLKPKKVNDEEAFDKAMKVVE